MIYSSPLLIETQQNNEVDLVLVVDVPEDVQIERTRTRDSVSEEQIRGIIQSQLPRKKRLEKADEIIDNSNTIEDVKRRISELHRSFLAKSKKSVS